MSYPTIPNITPHISVTLEDTLNLLLASIAMEEIALSHILNAEGENIQFALGTLFDKPKNEHCLTDIMAVNKEVRSTLTNVIRTEIVLQQKLDAIIDLIYTYHPPPCPNDREHCCPGHHRGCNHDNHHQAHKYCSCAYNPPSCSCDENDD